MVDRPTTARRGDRAQHAKPWFQGQRENALVPAEFRPRPSTQAGTKAAASCSSPRARSMTGRSAGNRRQPCLPQGRVTPDLICLSTGPNGPVPAAGARPSAGRKIYESICARRLSSAPSRTAMILHGPTRFGCARGVSGRLDLAAEHRIAAARHRDHRGSLHRERLDRFGTSARADRGPARVCGNHRAGRHVGGSEQGTARSQGSRPPGVRLERGCSIGRSGPVV
jgi:hypothetical protein